MDIAWSFLLLSLFPCVFSMYKNYTLQKDCSMYKFNEIEIGRENLSSAILTGGDYFKTRNGRRDLDCVLLIKAYFELGIMAVIQNMYLRKNQTTGECIDYIQFGLPKGRALDNLEYLLRFEIKKDKWIERKICGNLSAEERQTLNSLNDYSIKDKGGDLFIYVHIDRRPVLPNDTALQLEIVFTSYRDCRNNDGPYKQCDDFVCIHRNYFNDMVINCPLCKDELSCFPILPNINDPELNTKVTVTAVTSIFLSFFMFLGCMMLCRYFLLFRQWHQPPQVTTVEMTPPPQDVAPVATAPPEPSDKDLPPAYETLFPDR